MEAAQRWYESERKGLGAEFRRELAQTIGLLRSDTLIFPIVYRGARRALLHRFPYVLFFHVEATRVVVLACVHAKRDPRLVGAIIRSRRPR